MVNKDQFVCGNFRNRLTKLSCIVVIIKGNLYSVHLPLKVGSQSALQ